MVFRPLLPGDIMENRFHRHTRGGASYIISGLGGALDHFIDEYLRVNEKDC